MMNNITNIVVIIIVSIVIIVCSIGIIVASIFQKRQRKKYKECLDIIEKNKNQTFEVKNGLTKEEITKIDNTVDVDNLMKDLYEIFLDFQKKLKILDNNLDDVLTGYIKDFYINKIDNFNLKGYNDILDGIELINYSIIEFNKEDLKFRITINCFDYKMVNNVIVSGSNLEKYEEVFIITYNKIDNNWLISNIDKVYEKKLSD